MERPFALGFILCAVAVFCMAQTTVIRRLRDLSDVRLPVSITTDHVLKWNGTTWTNTAALYQFNTNQFATNGALVSIKNGFSATNAYIAGTLTNVVFRNIQQTLTYIGETNVLIDCQAGNYFALTVTNTTRLITTNHWTGWAGIVNIRQDGTGGYAITTDTNSIAYRLADGVPTFTTNALARDTLYLISGGEGTNTLGSTHNYFTP